MKEDVDGFLKYLEVEKGLAENTVAAYRKQLGILSASERHAL